MLISIQGTSLSVGRDAPEPPGPHDVDHACVTTGRRGFSMHTLLGLRGLKFPASPIGVFAPSIPITLEQVILFHTLIVFS